jgi:hypothetical protein
LQAPADHPVLINQANRTAGALTAPHHNCTSAEQLMSRSAQFHRNFVESAGSKLENNNPALLPTMCCWPASKPTACLTYCGTKKQHKQQLRPASAIHQLLLAQTAGVVPPLIS